MKNRGPDNQSFKKFEFNKKSLYFFSSRLKIVDRNDRSNQPMTFGNITIIFNGEIYNHEELREKILKKKCNLKTRSDTEIILELFERYGLDKIIPKLIGMFAFALFDRKYKNADRIADIKKNGLNKIYNRENTISINARLQVWTNKKN